MTGRNVLIKARAIIADPKKWGKGQNFNHLNGKHCAIGAINRAAFGVPMSVPSSQRAATARSIAIGKLEKCLPDSCHKDGRGLAVTRYNDKGRIRHKDILDLFDCAIKK